MTSSMMDHRAVSSGNHSRTSATPGSPPKSPRRQQQPRSRIPATLQAVFIASNRGNEVHKPPPDSAASKTFFRNWLFQSKPATGGSFEKYNTNNGKRNRKGAPFRSFTDHFSLPSFGRSKSSPHPKSKSKPANEAATPRSNSANETTSPKLTLHDQPVSPQKKKKKPQVTLEPQKYLDSMIRSRGYSTIRYKTLESGYYYKPTTLQLASYDPYIIRVVKQSDGDQLRKMLNCGMSPNPCNTFGESLLHTICRCGNATLLQIMIDANSDIAVADDYGRTPLHDACWSAKTNIFDVIELLLSKEDGPSMFYLADCRGSVPLQYVARDHWGEWIQWLEAHKDQYWPRRNRIADGEQPPPPLTQLPPQSRAAHVPTNPLRPDYARMLVSGKMTPEEIEVLRNTPVEEEGVDNDNDDDSDSEEGSDDDDSEHSSDPEDDSDDDSDDDDDDDDESMFDDQEEMEQLINYMKSRRGGGGSDATAGAPLVQ